MRFDRCLAQLWILAVTSAVPAVVGAQGFGLNEIGTCAVGRGYAVTGSPCNDASLIYWNPGAATMLRGFSIYAGAAAVLVDGQFAQDTTGRVFDSDVPVEVPPHAFLNYRWNRLALGLGVYVPYGLTSQWREDFPGRFQSLKASLASIYAQPNVAFDLVPGWSIGGGPVIGYSTVEINQGTDLALTPTACGASVCPTFGQLGFAPGTEFARARLEGDATAFGFNIGLYGQLTSTLTIGGRYLSELKFEYENGDATFRQVSTNLILAASNPLGAPAGTPLDAILASQFTGSGRLTTQKVSTTIRHPWQAQFGIGYTGLERTSLSLDFVRIGWSAFDRIRVDFQDPAKAPDRELIEEFADVWGLRVGGQHTLTNGWALRAGYSRAETPAPDVTVTPLLPDQDRNDYHIGIGIPVTSRFALDLAYLKVDTDGRRGRLAERLSAAQTAAQLNTGFYSLSANIISVSLKAGF